MAYKMKSSPAKQLWPWGKKPKKTSETEVSIGGPSGGTSITKTETSYRRNKKDEKNRVKKTVVDYHRGPMDKWQDGQWVESQPETHTRTTTKYDRKGNIKKTKTKDISIAGPFKMKGSPMQRNFGISPVKQVQLGPTSKRLINKGKKVVEKVGDFFKGFSSEEVKKRRNQRYRDYVKKSNKNPKKYPPKSSDEVY